MKLIYTVFFTISILHAIHGQSERLGIGTNSPTEKLDVNGDLKVDSLIIKGKLSTTFGNTIIEVDQINDNTYLANNAIAITSKGMGIGTSNPLFKIHVNGAINVSGFASARELLGPVKSDGNRVQYYNYQSENDISYLGSNAISVDATKNVKFGRNLITDQRLNLNKKIKIGIENDFISSIIRKQVDVDIGVLKSDFIYLRKFTVPGIEKGAAVQINVSGGDLPGGVGIGYAYVRQQDEIRFMIFNFGGNDKDIGNVTFDVIAIK